MKLHATILLSMAMLCLAVTTTFARSLYWVGGIGAWETITNWAQGSPTGAAPVSLPNSGDVVIISAGMPSMPSLNAATTVGTLNITGGGIALKGNILTAATINISGGLNTGGVISMTPVPNGKFVSTGTTTITGGFFNNVNIDAANFGKLQGATFNFDVVLNKTGTGNAGNLGDGMTYKGDLTFTNAGGNVGFGRNGANTYLGNVNLTNNGTGVLYLGEDNTAAISGNLAIDNNSTGNIQIGTGGGGIDVTGDIAITSGGGNLLLHNVTEGADATTPISGTGLGEFELLNSDIKSEVAITATTVDQIIGSTLSANSHSFTATNFDEVNTSTFGTTLGMSNSTTFIKTGGSGNPWNGGNTFKHAVIFTRSGGTNNNWRIADNTKNTFEGDVTINNTNSSGLFSFSDTNSDFFGNLALNGGASGSGGPVTFKGTGPQTISGTDGWTITTLNMENLNGLTIEPAILISNLLNFNVDGVVTMGSGKVLSFSNSNIAIFGANASRYIDGAVEKRGATSVADFTFEVGDGSVYAPFFYTTSNAGGTPQVIVQYLNTGAPGTTTPPLPSSALQTISGSEYWTLEVNGGPINSTAITLPYGVQSGLIGALANLRVARSTDGGANWEDLGGTVSGTLAGGTITSNAVNYPVGSYLVTLASIDVIATPLPVKLLYFDALPKDGQIQLKWATSQEVNNDYFQVERSADGQAFLPLGTPVPGVGTTEELQRYELTDESPLPGLSYYRLQQVDFDGRFEYSDVLSVQMETVDATLRLFPNPARGEFQAIWSEVDQIDGVRLISTNGQLLATDWQVFGNRVTINTSDIPAGMYVLVLHSGKTSKQQKVLIQP